MPACLPNVKNCDLMLMTFWRYVTESDGTTDVKGILHFIAHIPVSDVVVSLAWYYN
jgi:hypothetical protein